MGEVDDDAAAARGAHPGLLPGDQADVVAPSAEEVRRLGEDGVLVVHGVLGREAAAHLAGRLDALLAAEGAGAGREFRHLVPPAERGGADHLGGLLGKDAAFRACLVEPRILGLVRHVLGDPFRLHAMNARAPRAGGGRQALHTHPGLCSALWLLDDMTRDNGPTRVVPRSARRAAREEDDERDPMAPHPGERAILARAGAVVVLAGDVPHGGTANRSGAPRRLVTAAFSGPGMPPQVPAG